MTTTMTTQTPANLKADLTFNVFYTEDTTTQSFLPMLVSKNPWEWSALRPAFEGKKDVTITLVDRAIETPFHCLLAALFCKQLAEELHFRPKRLHLILTPLKKERPGQLTTVNGCFDMTANRNAFLIDCFMRVLGMKVYVTTKHNPVHCRDIKVTTSDYTLYIRCEGGIARGWQPSDKYLAQLPANELLDIHAEDLTCRSIYVHGHSQTGVFINIELQPNNFKNTYN